MVSRQTHFRAVPTAVNIVHAFQEPPDTDLLKQVTEVAGLEIS